MKKAHTTFDGKQLTAARALANLTVIGLARAADVTPRTIHRIETGGVFHVAPKKRHGHVSEEVWGKITAALAERGVELVPESEEHGSGVRWIQSRDERP
jgi:DNA-binding XRE family transcriptional regulator